MSGMFCAIAIPGFIDNYFWILAGSGDKVTLVDPGDAAPVLQWLRRHGREVGMIMITHHHADHIGGVMELLRHFPRAEVVAPSDPRISMTTRTVSEPDLVDIEDISASFSVLDFPGHTQSHIGYYCKFDDSHASLFCGDTLFACGCGRLFEGTAQQMYTSLRKIYRLPEHTKIYCAHEYTLGNIAFAKRVEPQNSALLSRAEEALRMRSDSIPTVPSVLRQEKATNPFLRASTPSVQRAVQTYYNQSFVSPVQVFAAVRSWKDAC